MAGGNEELSGGGGIAQSRGDSRCVVLVVGGGDVRALGLHAHQGQSQPARDGIWVGVVLCLGELGDAPLHTQTTGHNNTDVGLMPTKNCARASARNKAEW